MVGGLPERDDVRPVNRRQQELGTSILYRGTVSDLPQDGGKQLIDIREERREREKREERREKREERREKREERREKR